MRIWRGTRGGNAGKFATVQIRFHLDRGEAVNLIAANTYDVHDADKQLTRAELETAIRNALWLEGHPTGSEAGDTHGTDHEDDALDWADRQLSRFYPEWATP